MSAILNLIMYFEVINPDSEYYGQFFEAKREHAFHDYDRLYYGIYKAIDLAPKKVVVLESYEVEVVQERYVRYKPAN